MQVQCFSHTAFFCYCLKIHEREFPATAKKSLKKNTYELEEDQKQQQQLVLTLGPAAIQHPTPPRRRKTKAWQKTTEEKVVQIE
jgi:hypothetical protein